MADKALLMDETSGELIEVYAKDFDGSDKKEFFCGGRPIGNPNGPICMAKLDLVTKKGIGDYFAALSSESHHQFLCEYDMSEEARQIGYLDIMGRDTTMEELLDTFNRPQEGVNERLPDDGERGGIAHQDDFTDDMEVDLRPIERVPINPRAMKGLIELLNHKDPDELYAGSTVKDIFLNGEGIIELREHGLENGSVKIAILHKTSMDRIKSNYRLDFSSRGDIRRVVLTDAFSYDQKEKEQIFILSTSAYKKIYAAPNDSVVCVFANWKAHPRYSNVFLSVDEVEDGCITIMDKEYFE